MSQTPGGKFPQLLDTLQRMKAAECEGIPGVMCFHSTMPGPVLGITACTHGNEPSGLAAIRHILERFECRENLLRGTVYLAVNNLEAASNYFAGTDGKKWRFIDRNMNRLPDNISQLSGDGRSEIRRVRELLPIWRRFDVALDIHSTSQSSAPMIVSGGGTFHSALAQGFPIDVVISNIDAVQIGLPAFGYYGGGTGSSTPAFEIECGSHEDAASFESAITCVDSLLRNLNMIAGEARRTVATYSEYLIEDSIVFPNDTYRFARFIAGFEHLSAGEVIARGDGPPLEIPLECDAIFGPGKDEWQTWCDTSEEALFLSRPKRLLAAH